MGALALLGLPLLLPLLTVLLGQPLGVLAQSQVCSVNQTIFQFEENTIITGPLAVISVPEGQEVILGSSSTPSAFQIQNDQLFLIATLDYEETQILQAYLECKRGTTVVTQLRVLVSVLDVNDNAPEFSFTIKEQEVPEDTKVNSVVIPEEDLKATDRDKDDILIYTLQEVTPGASSFFSLEGANRPALRLDQSLDFYKMQTMTFQLLVRDTWDENKVPSHTTNATLVLKVLPADLRPPWFLPCTYSDGYVCLQAQYYGAIPTGYTLPSPLILRPGPIYAVDGDEGINQRIIYSIIGGNQDNTFVIDADSGNLTMAKIVPSAMTFLLLIRGEQADLARYSVTQVTVEARAATGEPPRFSQSLYRGTVVIGSGVGVAVKDATAPSQPLRIWAQDSEFPVFNSAITYRITNCSEFQMNGEFVLTAVALEQEGVFYAEVEAQNTVTSGTATTVAEIRVSELDPPSTEPPISPETGGTATSSSSTTSDTPRPPGTSEGHSTTSSDPHPPSGMPEDSPGVEPSGGQHFSIVDMAVLGGVLGALLLLTLIALAVLIYKHYGHRLNCCSGKAGKPQPGGFDNQAFLADDEVKWKPTPTPTPSPRPDPAPTEAPPAPPDPARPGPEPLRRASEAPAAARAGDSPSAVRSILTKERRPEGGYKAVWFGEDIGAEADVVVLNTPNADADGARDSGSEGSGDEDSGQARGGDSTDI
ncbi:cadherin-related family member 5 isoform X2 [Castor canadensis]|uniref:Cadherin-related family member 5 isoform X2 n=1 Tax=Castor canadensis TaxID=51338 RepID=A0AC58KSS3_CASCN